MGVILTAEALRAIGERYAQRVPPGKAGAPMTEATVREVPKAKNAARIAHLGRNLSRDRAKATVLQAEVAGARGNQKATLATISQERIIGRSDLLDLNYLEFAIAVARGVARVRLSDGAGTGFLVGPGVLMTNNHVLPSPAVAASAYAQFDYQENSAGELLPVQTFAFEPTRLFFTDPVLDFTIVAVADRSSSDRPVADYPWTKLIGTMGKATEGEALNIIQHPRGGLKQLAFRNNLITEIPSGKPDFLYYTTDTEPGSSGSPCFNDQWELVALHHSGVPQMRDGRILRKDGQPFVGGHDAADSIDWVANEGARVSAITDALRSGRLDGAAAALRDQLLDAPPPNPVELARSSVGGAMPTEPHRVTHGAQPAPRRGSVQVIVDLAGDDIRSVRVERATAEPPEAPATTATAPTRPRTPTRPPAVDPPAPGATDDPDETTAIDPDWSTREGYDTNFLGRAVPLPRLSAAQEKHTVVVPPEYRKGPKDRFNLHYHHYSLAFHAKRRLAWYSAANIDGDRMVKLDRGRDRWFIDPRIDDPASPQYQMGEELYAEAKTDRGHLTRFLDVAWGDDEGEALNATNDTFHFTNCSLQLAGFNQGKDRWQGLELFLLERKARKEARRMVVFTGPVFKRNDPAYSNRHMDYTVRIPLQFWKVCALIREDDSLAATGFLLGQPDVADLPGFEEKFDVTAAQVTIEHLESLTGLGFGRLKAHDHFAKGGDPGTLEVERSGKKRFIRPLASLEAIVI